MQLNVYRIEVTLVAVIGRKGGEKKGGKVTRTPSLIRNGHCNGANRNVAYQKDLAPVVVGALIIFNLGIEKRRNGGIPVKSMAEIFSEKRKGVKCEVA